MITGRLRGEVTLPRKFDVNNDSFSYIFGLHVYENF